MAICSEIAYAFEMDYDPILQSIVQKIRSIRESRDMSQESVAGLEISLRIYQKIEAGKGMPSLKTLLIIADSLGVHPKDLLDVPLLKDRPLKKEFPKRKRQNFVKKEVELLLKKKGRK
ncbi:helix-turn-helix domain-containing protein [Leptospira interrogans]|nr:helix-turn-helix transcriptional regulator [Leptospira interrogans]MCH1885162.1 helix-turn-helix domain-containing protein [Leptospira interrogans]MCH1891408.1 helix-turn-helix domain-containing protein [Leptospira interrogans]MCH1898202.1 helix-turn-helix domain-containing protein [Leptospira interrogans]MCH1901585.1 helix-turn-helix domain-containing protein [Leptospira interrogans]UPO18373.1 helix-turn-helix domain-containing protein [Leptospira interrogans]